MISIILFDSDLKPDIRLFDTKDKNEALNMLVEDMEENPAYNDYIEQKITGIQFKILED